MSVPMTAGQLVAQLARWGVTVTEHPGWRTHNRNAAGAWGPVNGSIVHHTASGDGPGITELCYDGRSDLPGPLCTGVVHKDGTVTLVGNGRANHAGAGAKNVYDAVVAEAAIPSPGPDAIDGNAHFYGWECVNLGDGSDPWPDVQMETIARVQAAVCEFHAWSTQSVIGHLEWTTRKIDPRGFTMVSMRALVAAHLRSGPATEADVSTPAEIASAVWSQQINDPSGGTTSAGTQVKNLGIKADREEGKVDALATATATANASTAVALAELTAAVQSIPVTLTDAQVASLAAALIADPVLTDAIAEAVAVKLAARLQS